MACKVGYLVLASCCIHHLTTANSSRSSLFSTGANDVGVLSTTLPKAVAHLSVSERFKRCLFSKCLHFRCESRSLRTFDTHLVWLNRLKPTTPTRWYYSLSARHKPYGPGQFFHILMVPSSLPVAYSLPSGEKLMLQIGPWCPLCTSVGC